MCSLIRDGTHNPPPRTVTGIPLLGVRNIIDGHFNRLSDDSLISEEDFKVLQKAFVIKENDILMGIIGTVGKVAIVENIGPFAVHRNLAIFRPDARLLNYEYLSYFLQSTQFQGLLQLNTGRTAQPAIFLGTISNFDCLIPPIETQIEIVSYLRNQTRKINVLMRKNQSMIDRLQEYRTALISAAVTGKIDVRGGTQTND